MRNALRHSRASEIAIAVSDENGVLRLTVADNGIGFEPHSVDQHTHFGLALMRERIEIIGGVLYVEARPGEGTRIVARLPSSHEEPRDGPPEGTRL